MHRIYFCGLLFLSLGLSLVSCGGKKTKFSKSELKWLDVYSIGDTIIFKSENGELDSSFIIKKEIFYPEYNPIEVHDKYLPQWGIIWYKNKKLEYHPDGYQMIEIIKKHPQNKTLLTIDYLYGSALILDITSEMDKLKVGKIFEFDTYHPNAASSQPKKIFWHEDFGIIRYITHNNIVWNRINLPGL